PLNPTVEPQKPLIPANFNSGKEIELISSHTLKGATDQLERKLIEEALLKTDYNISRTAKELGLSRRGLRLKMFQLGLEK
ncbi:MAG: hypothetical protein FD167_5502, partial [bacterium]